jgi:hypothetical protein
MFMIPFSAAIVAHALFTTYGGEECGKCALAHKQEWNLLF